MEETRKTEDGVRIVFWVVFFNNAKLSLNYLYLLFGFVPLI